MIINTNKLPTKIIELVNSNQHLEVELEDFFLNQTNLYKIHNHTIENLFLYFDLDKHLQKNRVVFYKHAILILDNRKHKFFIYDDSKFLSQYNFESITEDLKKKFIFYSSSVQVFSDSKFISSKLKEAVYNLDEVFSEETYFRKYEGRKHSEIKKKIYNRIKYPFNFLENNKSKFRVEDITEQHLEEMEKLHFDWVEFKLADPKTFKMMFSSARYNRTIRLMFNHLLMNRQDFFAKAFYWEDKLIAVRQCLVKDITSYDIAFFSRFWEVPSNLILYINSWCLKELKDNYKIQEHNCGMVLDKYLTLSKNHFPSQSRITYKYNLK